MPSPFISAAMQAGGASDVEKLVAELNEGVDAPGVTVFKKTEI